MKDELILDFRGKAGMNKRMFDRGLLNVLSTLVLGAGL